MKIKNRNIFRITRFILLRGPFLFKLLLPFRKNTSKTLLLIKIDAIGDYILFRNFIEVLKFSKKYQDYEIDLVGNILWKDLTLCYDSSFITNFRFIDPDMIYNSPLQALKLGWQLFKKGYEVVLQPTYSRTLLANGLAGLTNAKSILSFNSDSELNPRYKRITDKFYTSLYSLPITKKHEFERNLFFFEQVVGNKIDLGSPLLPVSESVPVDILVFLGSGYFKRNWSEEKLLEILKRILSATPYNIILAGAPTETSISNYLLSGLKSDRVFSLTGKTSLPEIIKKIASSKLVICNETSAVHIATACNVDCVCILGGGHFYRFAPYPANITTKVAYVYEIMECFECNWNCRINHKEQDPFPCITNISVEKVWKAIKEKLAL
ncbi:glycosyltransferase family 9 protein [Rubrolithibacter danxiaensis]|uniref:glycosyltransferase family 9 protein n=1 Tax=Rubrolithibacter danxiaensis TaxID=3390805 RepID=UPI003BF82CEB